MEEQWKKKIPFLRYSKEVVSLDKGFSYDKKFIIDNQYLLRVFSNKQIQRRKEEFVTVNKLGAYSDAIPKGIEFDVIEGTDMAYMILTYLPGKDAEIALKELTNEEQYRIGILAGKELKKLHRLSAPTDYPAWNTIKKQKSDRYLMELQQIDVDKRIKEMLETYIWENEMLLKGRPNTFQHDDFHPANILIHNRTFSGIIDFGRMDWGDPVHDLQKLGFFSKRISIPFTNGVIAGYHNEQPVAESFWKLYTLYSAMHVASSLVWGLKRSQAQYEIMLNYSLDVIRDHEDFTRVIPKWYKDGS
ncbi:MULTISPECIES: aminoglycoside phosphotransferase family protein [Oceanobacillus]|uniref:aminoglycoside phosphotransferase family protein n=1 Tax=Oceanobacillus TaxID=182709 RepID=UPI00203A3BB3|nr:aminoglycoside phosphotransferase family protein [Oceanobacillus profundus]MCM3399411.1 aminoglycoside phosphotransferase family protein [Oceanobacillus profundus]